MESSAHVGAGAALAFILAHQPDVDLDKITYEGPKDAADWMVDPLALLGEVLTAADRVRKHVNLWEHAEAAPGEENNEE